MREIRYLDKLIDELAKGTPMEKTLRWRGGDARGHDEVQQRASVRRSGDLSASG
jgi:hypothetical protein